MTRVKSMMHHTDSNGDVDSLIHPLVFSFSNGLLDWLALLDWINGVFNSADIKEELKTELKTRRDDLIRFGAPFLHGFREKYDDPFQMPDEHAAKSMGDSLASALDFSRPWRKFNDTVTRLRQLFPLSMPFKEGTIQQVTEMIHKKLSIKSAFLFTYAYEGGFAFHLLMEGQYLRKDFLFDDLIEFVNSLENYSEAK